MAIFLTERNSTGGAVLQAAPLCFDCSGFILTVYGDYVPSLPRVSRDMARIGEPVDRDNIQPGDMVFFTTGGRPNVITHVASCFFWRW